MRLYEALTAFLFPPRCLFCRKAVAAGHYFCASCSANFEKITQACPRCAAPLSIKGSCLWCGGYSFTFAEARAVARYRGEWRQVIHRLKYAGERYLARPLAKMLYSEVKRHPSLEFDLITAVPLHDYRLRERGYNQAFLLARQLSRLCGIPHKELVRRCMDTPSQTGLNRRQRLRNLERAFALNSPVERIQSVLIVDDVFTTGATVEAISRVLSASGVGKTYVVVAAR